MSMTMMKMSIIPVLLLVVSHAAYGRVIIKDLGSESLSVTETCQPIYGILPCSSNAWGLLFLIVVYEILLAFGARYVGMGSELFFRTIGPGIFGASLFQFLGTIPQITIVLASVLTGTTEAAQERGTLGMGLVAGSTVMKLTLLWGICIILGSYDLSEATPIDMSGSQKSTQTGYGVVTDVETSYTARIMLIPLVPFVIILLAEAFSSSSAKRVMVLIALIVSVILLSAFILYQAFRPWIQYRRFEYLMSKYAKDKLLKLLSTNGRPDTKKIQDLFHKIDKDRSTSVSAAELRVLLLGVKIDEDDFSTGRDVENILESFDTTEDGRITDEEFIKGMTRLVSDLAEHKLNPNKLGADSSQDNDQLEQGLLADSSSTNRSQRAINTWSNYLRAAFFIILGFAVMLALSQPLSDSVVSFATAVNLPSFSVSYLAIPLATNYRVAVQSLTSSRRRTQNSISLTLSALYGGVYMNNVVSLIVFLAPVYILNLSIDVFAEVLVIMTIITLMTALIGFRTTFPRWFGYIVVLLYPVSLASTYILTYVLGWP